MPASHGQIKGLKEWPVLWRPFDTSTPPSTKDYRVLNFAVDTSHPPYNYKDSSGRITGFSVELARLICQEYGLTCRFEAVPWNEIPIRLLDGRAEMAVASLKITQKMREKLSFTNRYFLNPARFVSLKSKFYTHSKPDMFSGKDIAVMKGSAHEAFLRDHYKASEIKSYDDRQAALQALKDEDVDLFFSDGVGLLFWMQSAKSDACCKFVPGAYVQRSYFGEGIGFSVSKKNDRLAEIFNFGLEKLRSNGVLERLYRVHFPILLY